MDQCQLRALRRSMRACEQTKGMSVLSHGIFVARYFADLKAHVTKGSPLQYAWRLPQWVYSTRLWDSLPSERDMLDYHVYHDCGKPSVAMVDASGRRHFPNHANASASAWLSIGGDSVVADLMAHDMDIHLLKDEGVDAFMKKPHFQALLLTGLAEIHANASMFGGIESDSFKMKWKQLNRRGNSIVTKLEGLAMRQSA